MNNEYVFDVDGARHHHPLLSFIASLSLVASTFYLHNRMSEDYGSSSPPYVISREHHTQETINVKRSRDPTITPTSQPTTQPYSEDVASFR
ncbi:MAG: hypothetical protein ACP5D2_01530 [Candidatus Nanoarchaeia archaeon]